MFNYDKKEMVVKRCLLLLLLDKEADIFYALMIFEA